MKLSQKCGSTIQIYGMSHVYFYNRNVVRGSAWVGGTGKDQREKFVQVMEQHVQNITQVTSD